VGDEYVEQPDGRLVAGPVLTQPEPDRARPLVGLLLISWVITCGFAFFLGTLLSSKVDVQTAMADRVLAGCLPTVTGAQVGAEAETRAAIDSLVQQAAATSSYQRVRGFVEPISSQAVADAFPRDRDTHIGFVLFENCLPGVA